MLRKEPMSKEVGEADAFTINDAFTSKLYKVKIGMVAAQVSSSLVGASSSMQERGRLPATSPPAAAGVCRVVVPALRTPCSWDLQ